MVEYCIGVSKTKYLTEIFLDHVCDMDIKWCIF